MNKTPAMDNSLTLQSAHAAEVAHAAHVDHPHQVQTQTQTQTQTLALPSVSEPWRYAWAYGRKALASLFGPHRLRTQGPRVYHAPVHISPRLALRWRALFDVPARAAASVPLLANQSVGTLIVRRHQAQRSRA